MTVANPDWHENGYYFVLRFLAEDVGRELNTVLDAILRALGRQRGCCHLPCGPTGSSPVDEPSGGRVRPHAPVHCSRSS